MNDVTLLKTLSPSDLAAIGLNYMAYVKRVVVNDVITYEIHAADGTEIGQARDHATAFAAIRQHELEPVSVH